MLSLFQKFFSKRFRALLCNNATGSVPWLGAVAEGEGPGFFTPDDAPWVIHADLATMPGGVRALLLQALWPESEITHAIRTILLADWRGQSSG